MTDLCAYFELFKTLNKKIIDYFCSTILTEPQLIFY